MKQWYSPCENKVACGAALVKISVNFLRLLNRQLLNRTLGQAYKCRVFRSGETVMPKLPSNPKLHPLLLCVCYDIVLKYFFHHSAYQNLVKLTMKSSRTTWVSSQIMFRGRAANSLVRNCGSEGSPAQRLRNFLPSDTLVTANRICYRLILLVRKFEVIVG